MKICMENDDRISVNGERIEVYTKSGQYSFDSSEIVQIDIITTDKGPFYDDMCLAIKVSGQEEAVIFIMSEHPLYRKFLFDELKQLVELDFQAIIDASACTENKIFPLYRR